MTSSFNEGDLAELIGMAATAAELASKALIKTAPEVAKAYRTLYQAFINEGFTIEQAEKFTVIAAQSTFGAGAKSK